MDKSELDKIDCKIIKDKTLSRHDALYKLILIGDTCKFFLTLSSIKSIKNLISKDNDLINNIFLSMSPA